MNEHTNKLLARLRTPVYSLYRDSSASFDDLKQDDSIEKALDTLVLAGADGVRDALTRQISLGSAVMRQNCLKLLTCKRFPFLEELKIKLWDTFGDKEPRGGYFLITDGDMGLESRYTLSGYSFEKVNDYYMIPDIVIHIMMILMIMLSGEPLVNLHESHLLADIPIMVEAYQGVNCAYSDLVNLYLACDFNDPSQLAKMVAKSLIENVTTIKLDNFRNAFGELAQGDKGPTASRIRQLVKYFSESMPKDSFEEYVLINGLVNIRRERDYLLAREASLSSKLEQKTRIIEELRVGMDHDSYHQKPAMATPRGAAFDARDPNMQPHAPTKTASMSMEEVQMREQKLRAEFEAQVLRERQDAEARLAAQQQETTSMKAQIQELIGLVGTLTMQQQASAAAAAEAAAAAAAAQTAAAAAQTAAAATAPATEKKAAKVPPLGRFSTTPREVPVMQYSSRGKRPMESSHEEYTGDISAGVSGTSTPRSVSSLAADQDGRAGKRSRSNSRERKGYERPDLRDIGPSVKPVTPRDDRVDANAVFEQFTDQKGIAYAWQRRH
jgi:hypothetical protein